MEGLGQTKDDLRDNQMIDWTQATVPLKTNLSFSLLLYLSFLLTPP
jgi:hypothetical protein